MKILYLGQYGIPARTTADTDERRVEMLAQTMSAQGHEVLVGIAKPFASSYVRRHGNAQLLHLFSSPEPHDSWIYAIANVVKAWQLRPDVIHVHGWKLAAFLPFLSLLLRNTTLVWTISTLPSFGRIGRLWTRVATKACDAVSTPYRQIQYSLLVTMNIRASYIPDGYTPTQLADIPATRWNLKKGQYTVLVSANPVEDSQWVLKAYSEARTKKRLVIVTRELTPELEWIHGRYPQAFVIVLHYGRAFTSLLRQSSAIIVGHDPKTQNSEQILQAMDAGVPLVLTANTAYEELIGTTGPVVRHGDIAALKQAINSVLAPQKHKDFSQRVQKRAHHFQWERTFDEYKGLYHYPLVRKVPFDSVIPRQSIPVQS